MDLLEKFAAITKRIPVKPLNNIAFWGLFVLSIYLSAQITWKLIPTSDFKSEWQPMGMVTQVQNGTTNFDVNEIQKLSLFGQTEKKIDKPKPVKQVITDAPKTNLSLQLTGVVASTHEQNGLAVIASSGSQETYSVGDKINRTSAILKEVFADRVIIANAGRYETLMLDGVKYTPSGELLKTRTSENGSNKVTKIDKRNNQKLARDIDMYREQIMQNPGKLSDYLSISPMRNQGELQGYRLNPGSNSEFFREAGLRPNDLAKSLNGYDLTDMNQSIEVMGQLPELTEISVIVERQGQLVEILLSLPQ